MSKMPEWVASSIRQGSRSASTQLVADLKGLEQPKWSVINTLILEHHLKDPPPKKEIPAGIYDSLKSRATLAILDAASQALGGASSLLANPANKLDPPFQVEHIYPRSTAKWDRDLNQRGINRTDMRARTNSLGNLSALSREINIKLSRKIFQDKKEDLLAQFSIDAHRVPMQLNSWALDLPGRTRWTPKEIDRRTKNYLSGLKRIWPDP